MKRKEATITDLAQMLGLNVSTVSRAMQDNPRISEETRRKVQKAAARLNYQPNSFAAGLRSGKSRLIGIVVPHINRFFFSNVIGGIEAAANRFGFQIIICQSNESFEQEKECINALIKSRVDGIILSLSAETRSYSHLRQVIAKGIPLVMFDRVCESLQASSVELNDYAGAYAATEHLIKAGKTRLCHLGGPQHLNVYRNRYKGFCDAMARHRLPLDESLVSFSALNRSSGSKEISKMISGKPDGIFAASDFSALGAYEFLMQKKISVPGDIAIVGFANEPFTGIMGMSSVEQHPEAIGENAARLFFDRLSHPKKKAKEKYVIEPELIVRASSDSNQSKSSQ